MKSYAVTLLAISLLSGGAAYAADPPAATPGSALISDTVVRPTDSPLVRAAKLAFAQRKGLLTRGTTVIDNDTLRTVGGHISTTNAQVALPDSASFVPTPVPAPAPTGPGPAERAQIQRRIDNLQREHAVMAHEADQPWSDEIDEGRVEKRMTEIPKEIEEAQRQLNPPPQPPSNPPQQ